MYLNEEILKFKMIRAKNRKMHISLTVVKDRLENIKSAFSEKSDYFAMLSSSEQLDFMLYVLEKFMSNSNIVDLETIEDKMRKINS